MFTDSRVFADVAALLLQFVNQTAESLQMWLLFSYNFLTRQQSHCRCGCQFVNQTAESLWMWLFFSYNLPITSGNLYKYHKMTVRGQGVLYPCHIRQLLAQGCPMRGQGLLYPCHIRQLLVQGCPMRGQSVSLSKGQ